MSQFSIPCVVYRGGTSRGIFFKKEDLPEDFEMQKKIFMAGVDAYNPSQINGLGSGTSHTSKVCVINKSDVVGADIDYTFYQVGVGIEIVDGNGTCGNLMAAAGAFAVNEGLVDVSPNQELVDVAIYNTNIGKMLQLSVPVKNRVAKVNGDYFISGLTQPGAKFTVNILSPGGVKTGKTLPIGVQYRVVTKTKSYLVTFVDVVNPMVYVPSYSLGLTGTELISELSSNNILLQELEEIRSLAAIAAGMYKTVEEAKKSPAIPKIAMVTEPTDYPTSSGKVIKASSVDIVTKMLSMGKVHRTFTGSGLYNIAAAVLLTGTLPNLLARQKDVSGEQIVRIGHPEGIVEVRVALTEDEQDVAYVGLDRTARRIIKGDLYIPN